MNVTKWGAFKCMHTYIHTYILTYLHTYILTYILTYIHLYCMYTYIHMYMYRCIFTSEFHVIFHMFFTGSQSQSTSGFTSRVPNVTLWSVRPRWWRIYSNNGWQPWRRRGSSSRSEHFSTVLMIIKWL